MKEFNPENKTQMKRRLLTAVSVLNREYKMIFFPRNKITFCFDKKQCVGLEGYYLQWEKDDTTTGSVYCWHTRKILNVK